MSATAGAWACAKLESGRASAVVGSSAVARGGVVPIAYASIKTGEVHTETLLEIDPNNGLSQLLVHITAELSPDARRLLQELADVAVRTPDDACRQPAGREREAAMHELEQTGLIIRVDGEPQVFHEAIRDWARETQVAAGP